MVEKGVAEMETSKRLKALLIAVVVVGWGAIGTNIYLNFSKKPFQPNTTGLDMVSGQTQHVSR